MKMSEDDNEIESLKALIAQGLSSGVSDKEAESIIEEIIARRRARNEAKDISCK